MPAKTVNMQYQIPQENLSARGSYDVLQQRAQLEHVDTDPRFAEQVTARLQLEQLFQANAQAARRNGETKALVESARQYAEQVPEHPTFAQIEPFLYEVGDWLAFDRTEVKNNGWPIS